MNSIFSAIFLLALPLTSYSDICVIPGHCGESSFDTKETVEPITIQEPQRAESVEQEAPLESHPHPEATIPHNQAYTPHLQDTNQEDAIRYTPSKENEALPKQIQKTINSNTETDILPATSYTESNTAVANSGTGTFQIGLIIAAILFIVIWKAVSENKTKTNARLIGINLIEAYLNELKKLRAQFTITGDFNLTNDQKWQRKKEEFLNKRIYPAIAQKFPKKASTLINQLAAEFESLIDIHTSDYKKLNFSLSQVNSPLDFEFLIANNLIGLGWDAKTTKTTGDQGVDVIAKKNGIDVAIQCKYYTNPVGNDAVQQVVAGKGFYKAHHAAVVTNSTYTYSAKQLAQSMGVLLLHHSELEQINQLA